ncbi:MAG: hypothetical protein DMG05_26125 [Acidobacteria bacterium]|nr:MAG: hypothetical protein DMG05_26125 [Acidobacteriota bacterium]TMQ31748.1 MAG: DUF3703 domain-containing protein [Nitrospirota bacterium]
MHAELTVHLRQGDECSDHAYDRDYLDEAFYHLERAHILGQSFTFAGGC